MAKKAEDRKVYAVDFDGTLCKSEYPKIGAENKRLIETLKEIRKGGDELILWTCRHGKPLEEAVEWCKERGLEFDAVNENLERFKKTFGETRKVFAHEYIDDLSVTPSRFILKMEVEKANEEKKESK